MFLQRQIAHLGSSSLAASLFFMVIPQILRKSAEMEHVNTNRFLFTYSQQTKEVYNLHAWYLHLCISLFVAVVSIFVHKV